jgi:hypothetical protein
VELPGIRSAELAEALAGQGYANLGPFLDEEALAQARAAFDDVAAELGPLGDRWFPTILLDDDALRARITTVLESLITPRLDAVLAPEAWDLLRVDYSVKPASPESELGPHQDFSLVDERRAASLYLWIPLVDTDDANGTLHVLPGSHRFANAIRSQHVPAYFDDVLDLVRDRAVRLDCRAGDLVLMVSGVVHFSPPNRSDELRLVAHGIATPRGVPLVFYYADEHTAPELVECYEVDLETYVRHIHQGRPGPEVPLARHAPRPPAHMTRARLLAGLAGAQG